MRWVAPANVTVPPTKVALVNVLLPPMVVPVVEPVKVPRAKPDSCKMIPIMRAEARFPKLMPDVWLMLSSDVALVMVKVEPGANVPETFELSDAGCAETDVNVMLALGFWFCPVIFSAGVIERTPVLVFVPD